MKSHTAAVNCRFTAVLAVAWVIEDSACAKLSPRPPTGCLKELSHDAPQRVAPIRSHRTDGHGVRRTASTRERRCTGFTQKYWPENADANITKYFELDGSGYMQERKRLADLCLWSAESSRTESLLVRVRRLFANNLCLLHASSDEFPNAIIEGHKVWRVPRKVRPSERCRAFRNTFLLLVPIFGSRVVRNKRSFLLWC